MDTQLTCKVHSTFAARKPRNAGVDGFVRSRSCFGPFPVRFQFFIPCRDKVFKRRSKRECEALRVERHVLTRFLFIVRFTLLRECDSSEKNPKNNTVTRFGFVMCNSGVNSQLESQASVDRA